jgi:SAM-dependent methyltransferase
MEKEDLAEEVFCLNFELKTLADQLLRQSSERWVPGFLYEKTEYSHIERYKLACEYTAGKKVIDIACGVGKGTHMMATMGLAESVYGADIQPEAIRYARWRFRAGNVTFKINDAQKLDIYDEFDVAVSFETIEHLPDYRNFLISVKKALKRGGLFLVSTPISSLPLDGNPGNPYHSQEWGFHEFQQVVNEFFVIEKVYAQLYPPVPVNTPPAKIKLLRRIVNRMKYEFLPPAVDSAGDMSASAPAHPFSKIEEYNGQYPFCELGGLRPGYQILIAKAK